MSAPADVEHDPAPAAAPRRASRSSTIQIVVLGVNLVFWAGILGWTLVGDHGNPPDRLDDRAFVDAAEPICAATRDRIAELGLPTEVDTPVERADMVDEENRILRAMVGELDGLPRPSGDEGDWVGQWLDDWLVHIQDRQDWADDLRAGDDHLFVESARAGEQVSKVVDNFAEVNDMEACATPGDV